MYNFILLYITDFLTSIKYWCVFDRIEHFHMNAWFKDYLRWNMELIENSQSYSCFWIYGNDYWKYKNLSLLLCSISAPFCNFERSCNCAIFLFLWDFFGFKWHSFSVVFFPMILSVLSDTLFCCFFSMNLLVLSDTLFLFLRDFFGFKWHSCKEFQRAAEAKCAKAPLYQIEENCQIWSF